MKSWLKARFTASSVFGLLTSGSLNKELMVTGIIADNHKK